jgi:hypothetical protein
MKAKAPFQLLVLDDNGKQLFNTYVANNYGPNAYNVAEESEAGQLVSDVSKAIANAQVDRTTPVWNMVN